MISSKTNKQNRRPIMTLTTIGLDLGDKFTNFCQVDKNNQIIEEGRITMRQNTIIKKWKKTLKTRFLMEAGGQSLWVKDVLISLGHEVLVLNAAQLPIIWKSFKKTDKNDARKIAKLGNILGKDMLPTIEHKSMEVMRDSSVLNMRSQLVRSRTKLVNQVRGMVKTTGKRLKSCSAESFHNLYENLEREDKNLLKPLFDTIKYITKKIKLLDKEIIKLSRKYFQTEILRSIPGVGPITALSFVLCIGNPKRFSDRRKIGAYLGLTPKVSQSGKCNHELGITKAGNRQLRSLLVQCSQYILGHFGPESRLRSWGKAIAERGSKTTKKKAVVAVARKLATIMRAMLITGEIYDPAR